MTTHPLVPTVDVKPLIDRNRNNVTAKAEAVRDQIYNYFRQACLAEGVDAVILKSYPYNDPVWVEFRCWLRNADEKHLTDRSTATVTILPREFHLYEHEINLEIRDGLKTKKYFSIVELDLSNVKALVHYMLRRTTFDIFGFKRVRTKWWELWLPRNVVTRLRRDWLRDSIPFLLMLGAFFILGTPLFGIFLGVVVDQLIGPAPFFYLLRSLFLLVFPMLGILCIAAAACLTVYTRFRPTYFLSPGKPAQEPRILRRLDSWQALVRNIAGESAKLRAAVRHELASGPIEGIQITDEKIWYDGIDGAEEREQMVLSFRRAIGFIHIYAYGKDLYVGWDAHLNAGTWVERQIADGLEPNTGQYCRVNTIASGLHILNEYDLTDANCLIEWIHAAVTNVTRKFMAEHRVDQEIDFQILRGERQAVLSSRSSGETAAPRARKARFRREA